MVGTATALPGCSLVELAEVLARGDASPVELVDALLDRVDHVDGAVGAFVSVLDDRARTHARAAEERRHRGEPLGPFDGVPVAVKDLYDFVPGVENSFGSTALGGFVPDRPSVTVERLERAGLVVLGKTNVPELGHKITTDNDRFGPTSSPFRRGTNAGGSSGGSAAAVAVGAVPAAIGSDGAGSIRVPASLCGVVGVKPTFGLVPSTSRPNGFRAASPLVQNGPLARSVVDAAGVLEVLAGHHVRDPLSAPGESGGLIAAARVALPPSRVAFSPDLGTFPVDRRVTAAVESAVTAFESLGSRVERVDVGLRSHRDLASVVRRAVGLGLLEALLRFEGFGADTQTASADVLDLAEEARGVTALDARADDVLRTEVYDALQDVLDEFDVLVTPTLTVLSVDNADDGRTVGPSEVEGQPVDPLLGWSLAYPCNLSGHPSVSVPAGLVDGLPVGMQVIGRRFGEASLLAACAAFERARPWAGWYADLPVWSEVP